MSSHGAERGDQTSASQQPSTRRSSGWKPRAEIMKRLSKLPCIPAILNFFSLIFSIINNADKFVPERDYKMDEAKEDWMRMVSEKESTTKKTGENEIQ